MPRSSAYVRLLNLIHTKFLTFKSTPSRFPNRLDDLEERQMKTASKVLGMFEKKTGETTKATLLDQLRSIIIQELGDVEQDLGIHSRRIARTLHVAGTLGVPVSTLRPSIHAQHVEAAVEEEKRWSLYVVE